MRTPRRPSSGAAGAVGARVAFVRVPWLLPVAVLACAPARIPVSVGSTKANLLLPLYVVVAAAVLALAWRLLRGDSRARELGPLAWPLALLRRLDRARAHVVGRPTAGRDLPALLRAPVRAPRGLALAAAVADRLGEGLYVQLAAMAFVFAAIGGWQYLTRNVFWNPKVIVDNAYAPGAGSTA